MDEFVHRKLTEWGLSELIETFKAECINAEALYCLSDQDLGMLNIKVGLKALLRKKLKLLQADRQQTTHQETAGSSPRRHAEGADSAQDCPSSSGTRDKGKRTLDLRGKSTSCLSPASKRHCDKRLGASTEGTVTTFTDVKNKMQNVLEKLSNENSSSELNEFLKKKIQNLEMKKTELVGVFGKTGAGKSSLINAIIGVKNLLPVTTRSVSACTSVMIKVEANKVSTKYEADIEFITKEDWEEELWPLSCNRKDNADWENDLDIDTAEKLTALYGDEWKTVSPESLMDNKYFREIPEFLQSKDNKKTLTCGSAKELSAKCVKYTRSDLEEGEGSGVKRWYWPLVKCVTIRVPGNDLLQHVTLVDLPGNGDRNKSRDEMWKELVGCCSTVWIVTEINRAASEREAWEILEDACSLMGNGGECQRIHFICTKSDMTVSDDDHPAAVRDRILKRNSEAKKKVMAVFRKENMIKKHFSEECFKVFTVSSEEFLKRKYLQQDNTEIPQVQGLLRDLNTNHLKLEELNYVSGANGILSLIQGARYSGVAGKKTEVCRELEETMRQELDKVRKPMEEAYKAFERCLTEGVEQSKRSCEATVKSILYPKKAPGQKTGAGSSFHKTLKYLVKNNGTYKPKRQRQMNVNEKLSSFLTDSIDEEFRKTFPNERECGAFNGAIAAFTLDTERLIQEYREVELQLTFLQTEEEKIKATLNRVIRERKKIMYRSLTEKIKEHMQECYDKAAEFSGTGSMDKMRVTIERHVERSKYIMFVKAKDGFMGHMMDLKEYILKTLEESLMESIKLSLLRTDDHSIPDVSAELDLVKRHYDEMNSNSGEISLTGSPDPPAPAAALGP